MHRFTVVESFLLCLSLSQACSGAAAVSGIVTGADGAAVADAVVFVQAPSISPEKARAMGVVDQVNKTFVPGLLPIVVGTSVRFPNHDQIHHHVYSFSPAKSFELPLYKGEDAAPVLFDKVGVVKIGCNIHDWMSGIILVLPSPHFAVTDAAGRFALENIPSGTYTIVAWHALSKLRPEDTARTMQISGDITNLSFTLPLAPARPRPAMHGVRGEP